MSELFEFGRYAPYIAASYGASAFVLGFFIFQRRAKLNKARDTERQSKAKPQS